MRAALLALVVAACGGAPDPSPSARDARTVDITIAHAGASAAELEAQVAIPVERALMRVPGVRAIESRLDAGGATISVELANRAAVDVRLRDVRDAVASIQAALPAEAAYPVVQRRPSPPVLVLEVTGSQPAALLSDVARDVVRPRLERIAGVTQVDVDGAVTTVVAIRPDLARLAALGVTLRDLEAAIRTHAVDVPAGRLASTGVQLRVDAALRDLDALGAIVVRAGETVVTVRDVATIETTTAATTDRPVDGATEPDFPRLAVRMQAGASPRAVVTAVRREVGALARELPPGVRIGERPLPATAPAPAAWLVGDDGSTLDAAATLVADALADAQLAAIVRDPPAGTPAHTLELDRDALARHGIAASEVAATLRMAVADHRVAHLQQDGRDRDVVVRLAGARDLSAALADVSVRGSGGALVPLASVARVRLGLDHAILRRDGRRAIRFALPADAARARTVIEGVRSRLPAGVELAFAR